MKTIKARRVRTGLKWGRWLVLTCLFAILHFHLAAATVKRISWESAANYTRFAIELDQEIVYHLVDSIREKGYYYVDLYGISAAYRRRVLEIDDQLVRNVESISYPEHGVLRFVFYVKPAASLARISKETSPFRLYIDTLSDFAQSLASETGGTTSPPTSPWLSSQPIVIRDKQVNKYVPPIPEPPPQPLLSGRAVGPRKIVIIDPGHGGANQGAVSTALVSGRPVAEKELTLQFAYHLKKLIDSSPNMVALLTRTGDTLVSLSDRVAFAEKQKGDLFISLHMNDGAGNPNARGPEVFYLSQKGADDAAAKAVAERENIDVLSNGMETRHDAPLLAQVLTDLERQKLESWQYESYVVADRILQSLQQHPYFRSYARGVKSANFVVLKNFYMPAVLVEVGFITNTDELRLLVSPKFQKLTAILLYNAINSYFAQTDPNFQPDYKRMSAALE